MTDETAENDPQHGPARPQSPPAPVGFLARETAAGDGDNFGEPSADQEETAGAPSPAPPPGSGLPAHLEELADRARGYVEAATSPNTRRAYDSDWKQYLSWCRRQSLEHLPPDPQRI